jgi:LPS sulfotransferase NodH
MELERMKAAAQLEIEKLKINASADADVEMAIGKIKSLALIHETKMKAAISQKEAEQEGEANGAAEGEKVNNAQSAEFSQALKQIVDGLQSKKKISITRQNGQITGATVS